jgi:hypothetical protein
VGAAAVRTIFEQYSRQSDQSAHLYCILLTCQVDASLELVDGRGEESRDLELQRPEQLCFGRLVDTLHDDLRLDIEAEEFAVPCRRRKVDVVEGEDASERGGELARELVRPR